MLFLDSETMGFVGPTVIYQYAVDDGDVKVHDVWLRPVSETLELLEWFCTQPVCAFNLVFDWFHVVQQYNVLLQIQNRYLVPDPVEYWHIEKTNPCSHFLKPPGALDLMLWAQASERYQFLMPRRSIVLRRVPRRSAYVLADQLEELRLHPGLFAGFKQGRPRKWSVTELDDPDPEFVNITLKFNPSRRLDVIAQDALGRGKAPSFFQYLPDVDEYPYRPYGGGWVNLANHFMDFWKSHEGARFYAIEDVRILQQLYKKFGKPDADSVDAALAISVANTRWKGLRVDRDEVQRIRESAQEQVDSCPFNIHSPKQTLRYIKAKLPPVYRAVVKSTSKKALEPLVTKAIPGWERCKYVIDVRRAAARVRDFAKMEFAERFHPAFNIIGTLTTRMAGTGGFNAQGVNKELRHAFPFADPGELLSGGDFEGFEIGIACAVYNDPQLISDFTGGKKMHAIMAESLFQMGYEDILRTSSGVCGVCGGGGVLKIEDEEAYEDVKRWAGAEWTGQRIEKDCSFCDGSGEVTDLYGRGKAAFFASMYGAQGAKLSLITGLPVEDTKIRLVEYQNRYPVMLRGKTAIEIAHSAMIQPGRVGKIQWRTPKTYAESLLGWRRHFNLEYEIQKFLHDMAQKYGAGWKRFGEYDVERTAGRIQTTPAAMRSALYGAAFSLQGLIIRQVGNHQIQSTGASITKGLQARLWQRQPVGVHPPKVALFNVHDEIEAVTGPDLDLTDDVAETLEEYRKVVPLLSMNWKTGIKSWADK